MFRFLEDARIPAGLYSLVATCEARAINPFEYLADVLPRIADRTSAERLGGAQA